MSRRSRWISILSKSMEVSLERHRHSGPPRSARRARDRRQKTQRAEQAHRRAPRVRGGPRAEGRARRASWRRAGARCRRRRVCGEWHRLRGPGSNERLREAIPAQGPLLLPRGESAEKRAWTRDASRARQGAPRGFSVQCGGESASLRAGHLPRGGRAILRGAFRIVKVLRAGLRGQRAGRVRAADLRGDSQRRRARAGDGDGHGHGNGQRTRSSVSPSGTWRIAIEFMQ